MKNSEISKFKEHVTQIYQHVIYYVSQILKQPPHTHTHKTGLPLIQFVQILSLCIEVVTKSVLALLPFLFLCSSVSSEASYHPKRQPLPYFSQGSPFPSPLRLFIENAHGARLSMLFIIVFLSERKITE